MPNETNQVETSQVEQANNNNLENELIAIKSTLSKHTPRLDKINREIVKIKSDVRLDQINENTSGLEDIQVDIVAVKEGTADLQGKVSEIKTTVDTIVNKVGRDPILKRMYVGFGLLVIIVILLFCLLYGLDKINVLDKILKSIENIFSKNTQTG